MSRTKAQVVIDGVEDGNLGFWAFADVPFFCLVISDESGYMTHMMTPEAWEKAKRKIDEQLAIHYPKSPPPGEDW